ncbi:MAG: hypothetical protein FJZ58_05475, partial [Chlamydiae bacterium]|nr:hypothetical protein [Chlamydiota bacterium]
MRREYHFTAQDIKRIFLRRRAFYLRVFCGIYVGVVVIFCSVSSSYSSTALFKQVTSPTEEADLLQSFLQQSGLANKESGARAILESRSLLAEVVGELGLQGELVTSLWETWLQKASQRLKAEVGIVSRDKKKIAFSHVSYGKEKSKEFFVHFVEQGYFEVLDKHGKKQAEGVVGYPVQTSWGHFTLDKVESEVKGTTYHLRLLPAMQCVENLRKHLRIKPNKIDKSTLVLQFSHPKRDIAIALLNSLMKAFQRRLYQENAQVASVQLDYLNRRQKELLQGYEEALETHALFLQEHLQKGGGMSLQQEMEGLQKPEERLSHRLHDIDLCLDRIGSPKPSLSMEHTSFFSGEKSIVHEPIMLAEDMHKLWVGVAEKKSLQAAHTKELRQWQRQLQDPSFEFTALGTVLIDPTSQELLQKASSFALQLQDVHLYSSKDRERIKEALQGCRQFLSEHLDQLASMSQKQEQILEANRLSLQRSYAVLLQKEKEVLQTRLETFSDKRQDLPFLWKKENQLFMQRDMSLSMMEGLNQLVEAKNIKAQLFHVESKPIDGAYAPLVPTRFFILAQGLLAGCLGTLCFFSRSFWRWLSQGRAITASLDSRDVIFCGFLREQGMKQDSGPEAKETLRKVVFSLSLLPGKRVLVLSQSDEVPMRIAKMHHQRGKRVLWINASFSQVGALASDGFYDMLADAAVKPGFIQEEGVTYLSAGRYREHFVELLSQESLSCFLQSIDAEYDLILLS